MVTFCRTIRHVTTRIQRAPKQTERHHRYRSRLPASLRVKKVIFIWPTRLFAQVQIHRFSSIAFVKSAKTSLPLLKTLKKRKYRNKSHVLKLECLIPPTTGNWETENYIKRQPNAKRAITVVLRNLWTEVRRKKSKDKIQKLKCWHKRWPTSRLEVLLLLWPAR